MITVKLIGTFPNPAEMMTKLTERPPELIQMIQLVKFWATQHGVSVVAPEFDTVAGKAVWEFQIPNQQIWDEVLAHAGDNSIDVFDLGDQLRTYMESFGGSLERIIDGAEGP